LEVAEFLVGQRDQWGGEVGAFAKLEGFEQRSFGD